MSVKADIKQSANWFIGERKQFVYTVRDINGNLVDVSGWDIEWALMKKPGAAHLLHKEKGVAQEIVIEADPDTDTMAVVIVTLEEGEALDAGLRAAIPYYIELKRTDSAAVLGHGYATASLSGI